MVVGYAPDVQAEIDKQLIAAKVAEMQSGGIQFPEPPLADGALDGGSDTRGSMAMASDPGSRDKITIYSTETGHPSRVLVNMLAKKLTQKLTDGRPVWSIAPTKEYFVGENKCYLHPDHPMRAELDRIGLVDKTCPKKNIPSEFEVRQHMIHRHKQEMSVIEEARAAAEREEERAFRRMQMAQMERLNEPTRRGRKPMDEPED